MSQADSDASIFSAPAAERHAFGVYIHIPFCRHICSYCDFNTYAGQSGLIPKYVDALRQEISMWAQFFRGQTASSIFFGGGTPSLLSPTQVRAILTSCASAFDVDPAAEVTIETNPNDLSQLYCAGLIEAGVNRISIGAQTLDRRGLRVLGRLHEAQDVSKAVAAARAAGFANLSLDFIYGWPGQRVEEWRDDLRRILDGGIGHSVPDHLSLYGLILEPGTPIFEAARRRILTPVDDDDAADMFEVAREELARVKWTHYEIANWSSTPATASRHNAHYWRNGEYAGIGAGAHGRAGEKRTMNHPLPAKYMSLLESGQSPVSNTEVIDRRTSMGETMMLGLRLLIDGVSRRQFAIRHGISIDEQFGSQIETLANQGLLEASKDRIRLSARGALLANSVCAEFI